MQKQSGPKILLSLTLIVITLSIYWQVGNHEFLNYDDTAYITKNPHVMTGLAGANIVWAFTSVDAANWHPITWLSHMADATLYGMHPSGHHLTNVVIHALSAVLLFLLLSRLTGSLWRSAFVAALFALHPLHVESVAWAAERKDVLSAFFWFLTLLLYSKYVKERKQTLYVLALFAFVMGLMSKPMLVTLPAVMLLLDYWPLNRFRIEAQEKRPTNLLGNLSPLSAILKEKIPFVIFSLLSAAMTIYAQGNGGAIKELNGFPLGLRIGNAVVAYVKYIGKTLWPHDLAVFYPVPSSVPLWQVICSLSLLIFVSAAALRAARSHPYLAVGWFWFLITLVPVIGLIQVGEQSMADRYSYIPLTGLFIMAAWGASALTKDLRYRQGILAFSAGAVICASAALTWQQLAYWRDSVSLFQHDLDVTSDNFRGHANLGEALMNRGDLDAAIREYEVALSINPKDYISHSNLGVAQKGKGNLDEAIRQYQAALAINPKDSISYVNLGVALAFKGDLDSAIKAFQEALAVDPKSIEAQNNLGNALDLKRMRNNISN